jgi:hypothetical protein
MSAPTEHIRPARAHRPTIGAVRLRLKTAHGPTGSQGGWWTRSTRPAPLQRKSSLGLAGVSVAIDDQIVEVLLPPGVAGPIKECSSAGDQCLCGDGRA